MQYALFGSSIKPKISFEEILQAYYDCRKNKRQTSNALAFEINYESNLLSLLSEINNGTYSVGRSIAFIVHKPVQREIFAADFRDRVVHHLIINKLNPHFEKKFILDSYSCRVGKGTHYGIKRVDRFIRRCSKNYSQDCYILKLDIQGFFMHINKQILFDMLRPFIETNYTQDDKELLIDLCRKVVFNNSTQGCLIKGEKYNWKGLPRNKSLFHSGLGIGLPIGNLTSQVFANFYMDAFDHFVKHNLGLKYYGRYVDDFVLVHPSKVYLTKLMPLLSRFLQDELGLKIHPKKKYLQHYTKGVKFVGAVLKPNRIYIANRTKGNMYDAISKFNTIARTQKIQAHNVDALLCSMNSYLGIMKHYKTYKIRRVMTKKGLSAWWWNHVYVSGGATKLVKKNKKVRSKIMTNYCKDYWDVAFDEICN